MIPKEFSYEGSDKEFQFRDKFIMPLLKKLGFAAIVNYHGSREFGRDVIFGEVDRFGHFVYHAMQIKFEASIGLGDSHSIAQDAEQATQHPFRHPQTGREEYVSCFYVANAGDFSDHARENFFKITRGRGVRDAKLLDGKALLFLEQSVSQNDNQTKAVNQPTVEVSLGLTRHPKGTWIDYLVITFLNKSDRAVFLGNFVLLTSDNMSLFFPIDTITGAQQQKRKVEPGDSVDFHIDAADLKQRGEPAANYTHACVLDAVGGSYTSSTESIQKCMKQLLETDSNAAKR